LEGITLAPLGFDDDQLVVIRQLAEPIRPPSVRSVFLEALVAELARLHVVSGGDILRIGQRLQRSFLAGTGSTSNAAHSVAYSATRLRAEREFRSPSGSHRPQPGTSAFSGGAERP
jgi:hypothetical protein